MTIPARRRRQSCAAFAAAWLLASPAVAGPTIPDLVEVGDITSLSASPNGEKIVFRVERASVADNGYVIDWYAADLDTATTRHIAGGGKPIEGGVEPLAVESAVWSPDGRFVYHRALIDGAIGIWRTAIDGSGSWPAVAGDADVESIVADSGGRTLTYVLGPTRAEIERAEQREYDEGILIDGSIDLSQNLYRGGWVHGRLASQRMVGQWYTRAGLLWQAPRHSYRLDLQSLETHPVETTEGPAMAPLTPIADVTLTLEVPGRPAVRIRREKGRSAIEIERSGRVNACEADACRAVRVVAAAWRPGTDELAFTVQDGHYRQSLYLWDTARGSVRSVAATVGLLSGSRDPSRPCVLTHAAAVCVTASAVRPPRLERIDLTSGARTVLFDPNQLLRTRETARVEQTTWTLEDGRKATGTLLLPRGHHGPAPLFISYYACPGYLRGGIGDEFPFAPLVDAGFVVACLNMVPGTGNDIVAGYEAALSDIERLVDLLSARALIDPRRVGMGGFSAGSEATMWVATHSHLLAAAAVASPQYAPSDYWRNAIPGRDYTAVLRSFLALGSPDETPARWRVVSPALNADRITAPLLMQLPESEARAQAELLSRLSVGPTPVELYAFPDESHVKFQPRHRQAAYRRSFDWFRYWLQNRSDGDPAKAEQYRRWDALRMRRDEAQPSNERSQVSAADKSSKRM